MAKVKNVSLQMTLTTTTTQGYDNSSLDIHHSEHTMDPQFHFELMTLFHITFICTLYDIVLPNKCLSISIQC